jgi:hypothetical protein
MSVSRIMIGIAVCLAALLVGCTIGLAMSGFGTSPLSLTTGLVGYSAAVGAIFGAAMAFIWRKSWWAGALAFSLPTLLGVAFGVSAGEWQRVVGIAVCNGASILAAFVVRYSGPQRLSG